MRSGLRSKWSSTEVDFDGRMTVVFDGLVVARFTPVVLDGGAGWVDCEFPTATELRWKQVDQSVNVVVPVPAVEW